MPKFITTLPLIATLALSTALYAQDDTTAEAAAETENAEAAAEEAAGTEETVADTDGAETTAEGAAEPDTSLDLGQEDVQDPTYIKETYGDWQLKCFRNETAEDLCQMHQLLTEDAGNPVAEISIFKLPAGSQAEAGATIVVPLGTLLSQELKISIDSGKAKSFSYSFCTQFGCFARIGLSKSDIAAFKRGVTANLQIVPAQAPDQKVNIKASLKGFTAAYDNTSTVQK